MKSPFAAVTTSMSGSAAAKKVGPDAADERAEGSLNGFPVVGVRDADSHRIVRARNRHAGHAGATYDHANRIPQCIQLVLGKCRTIDFQNKVRPALEIKAKRHLPLRKPARKVIQRAFRQKVGQRDQAAKDDDDRVKRDPVT